MNELSRTSRSMRNVSVSLSTQAVLLVLAFVSRSVFVTYLGVEVLGVNTLFMSLLAVLGLADLGLNTAVMYSLYRPLATGDETAIAALVRLCGDLYRYVALAITVLGLVVALFLDRLVDAELPAREMYAGYLLLLATTALTYLMAHRAVLLVADQRLYLTTFYTFLFTAARHVSQIVVLVLTGSWLLFLTLHLVLTLASNAFVFWRIGRLYPYLGRLRPSLSGQERRDVLAHVRAMVVYRVGGVLLNNTDPVLISLLLGTVTLGYYSNYLLVVGSVLTFTELFFGSLAASVGNLSASSDAARGRLVFEEIGLLAFWIYGSVAVAFWVALDDVISLWLGETFVLEPVVALAVALNFYVYGVMSPVLAYRTATGVFRETRYVMLVTAAVNLLLSLALGSLIGLEGILFATVVARLSTNFWYEPWKLFSRHLGASSRDHFVRQLGFAALLLIAAALVALVVQPLDGRRVAAVVVGSLAAVVVVTVLVVAVFGRTPAARSVLARGKSLVR
jgi:O-antigen/teichoic acid export membrane protein